VLVSPSAFERWWVELVTEMEKVSSGRLDPRQVKEVAAISDDAYETFMAWIGVHKHLAAKLNAMLRDRPANPESIQGEFESIRRGEPLVRITSSVALIRGLALAEARGDSVDLSARVAALLSLWSTFKLEAQRRTVYRVEFSRGSSTGHAKEPASR